MLKHKIRKSRKNILSLLESVTDLERREEKKVKKEKKRNAIIGKDIIKIVHCVCHTLCQSFCLSFFFYNYIISNRTLLNKNSLSTSSDETEKSSANTPSDRARSETIAEKNRTPGRNESKTQTVEHGPTSFFVRCLHLKRNLYLVVFTRCHC